jgi:hypothetical protein
MGVRLISLCFAGLAAALSYACAATAPTLLAPQQVAAAVQPIAAAADAQVEPARLGDEEPVCRKQSVTGSHRPRVICQTAAQRRATREAAQAWYRTSGRTGEISQVPVVP